MRLPLLAFMISALLLAACGGDDTSSTASEADFKTLLGETCTSFYAEAGALQTQLSELAITEQSSEADKEQALATVEQIQERSAQFLDDLRGLPDPPEESAQEDLAALVDSTESFLEVQGETFGNVEQILDGTASSADQQAVVEGRSQLEAELAEQRVLLSRLDVPECLPPQ